MSRAAGLRNWRGEIIPSVASAAPSGVARGTLETSEDLLRNVVASKGAQPVANETVSAVEDQRSLPTIVVQKDEFGRDVQVVVDKCKRDKERKHKRKRSDKRGRKSGRDRSSVDRSRSSSRRRRRGSTPPPPDPFRPELDACRDNSLKRRNQSRSRSRSQRRSRDETKSHSRRSRRRDVSPSRSRSRGEGRGRGRHHRRSRSTTRSSRRRSSASVERKWTHNAFDDRSPSPPREPDPFYRPEPEAWVSRAGGVYLPRK